MRVLVTGGAGFVGANLAVGLLSRRPEWDVIAFDNLKRRGSELNVPRLREAGVTFTHGDVRDRDDLLTVDSFDALVECSAEPSALAGLETATEYSVKTNLVGAYHCLELARHRDAQLIFLSTSRVYPVGALHRVRYDEMDVRFELGDRQEIPGVSRAGISEAFPLDGARTLYGATKLAAELLIAEYVEFHGLRAVVNRCGVIAGPWQMGRVDQGVFTYWMLAHYFRSELRYLGYGGSGKQVRDLLHVEDLVALIEEQLASPNRWSGFVANVGGGRPCSLSLREGTELCREITGNQIEVEGVAEARKGDVPVYISDCSFLHGRTTWRPQRSPRDILEDVFRWIHDNERTVSAALNLR